MFSQSDIIQRPDPYDTSHQYIGIHSSLVTIEFCSFSGSGSLLSVSSSSSSSLSTKAGIIFDLIRDLQKTNKNTGEGMFVTEP